MNYIKSCVYILITAMVLSLALTYASLMTIIGTSKDNTERVLTGYVVENSTIIYNSIKNGTDFTNTLDTEHFRTRYRAEITKAYKLKIPVRHVPSSEIVDLQNENGGLIYE